MKRALIIFIILLPLSTATIDHGSFSINYGSLDYSGDILYVGGHGPQNYSKIQDAIDNASNGDTIFVYDDSSPYYENIVVDKSIHLKGENTDTTIIDGTFSNNVVKINYVDRVNISKFTIIHGSPYGILLEVSSNSMLADCKIYENEVGMHVSHSSCNTLINLSVSQNNPWGILFNYHSNNNTIINCNISDNGGPLGDSVGIYLSSWSNYNSIISTLIKNNGIGPWNTGILLEYYANHTIISNCTVSYDGNEGIGICFGGIFCSSNHNIVSNCDISGGGDGISIVYSTNNSILDSQIWSTINGICVSSASKTYVRGCDIHDNLYGVEFYHSPINSIISSNISYNGIGVRIRDDAADNMIYHNNFFDNTQNGFDECTGNRWDNNYPKGGNFWDDYDGTDNDGDGIGDSSYEIEGGNNEDEYPLMQPYAPTELELEIRNKVALRNLGSADAYAASLIIEIKGGILGLINKTLEYIIGILPIGDERVFSFPFIFGLGRITMTITAIAGNAEEITATIKGFAIGPFIFVFP